MAFFDEFKNLDIDTSLIGLEKGPEEGGYFCTPVGAKVFGWECEGIHYCFIEGFGETVFAVNPETAEEHYVRPLAENFEKFISLLLACKSTTAAEQISGWSKEQFEHFVEHEDDNYAQKRERVLKTIESQLGIKPLENPFEYVKSIQRNFNYEKLQYSAEYYDVLGIEPPEGIVLPKREEQYFEATVFKVDFLEKEK